MCLIILIHISILFISNLKKEIEQNLEKTKHNGEAYFVTFFVWALMARILRYISYSITHAAIPYHRFIVDIFHLCSFPRHTRYVERCAGVAYISRLRSSRVTLFFVLEGKLTMRAKINIRLLSVAKSKLINIARWQNRIRYMNVQCNKY